MTLKRAAFLRASERGDSSRCKGVVVVGPLLQRALLIAVLQLHRRGAETEKLVLLARCWYGLHDSRAVSPPPVYDRSVTGICDGVVVRLDEGLGIAAQAVGETGTYHTLRLYRGGQCSQASQADGGASDDGGAPGQTVPLRLKVRLAILLPRSATPDGSSRVPCYGRPYRGKDPEVS